MGTLYAPQVEAIQPAFIYAKGYNDTGKVTINFKTSVYQDGNYNHIRIKIVDPNLASGWGTNSMFKDNSEYKDYSCTENSIEIDLYNDIFKNFTTNQYYQVQ